MRTRRKYTVIQKNKEDFVQYKPMAKLLINAESIPFTRINFLKYDRNLCSVKYGTGFDENESSTVSIPIFRNSSKSGDNARSIGNFAYPKCKACVPTSIAEEKIVDIHSLYPHFNREDKDFYNSAFSLKK